MLRVIRFILDFFKELLAVVLVSLLVDLLGPPGIPLAFLCYALLWVAKVHLDQRIATGIDRD